MNRLSKTALILLLVAGITAPSTLVKAKTVEDVPTTESSILSRTADPTRVSQERLAQDEAEKMDDNVEESSDKKTDESTEESETKESSNKETVSSSDKTMESSAESSNETTESTKEKKKQNKGLLRADTDKLVEGTYGVDDPNDYDIDKTLSYWLRQSNSGNTMNSDFTGLYKAANQLTFGDMKTLTKLMITSKSVNGLGRPGPKSLKGLEYASNLSNLTFGEMSNDCIGSDVLNLNIFPNLKFFESMEGSEFVEVIADQCTKLETVRLFYNRKMTQFNAKSVPSLVNLQIAYCDLKKVSIEGNTLIENVELSSNSINEFMVGGNPKLRIIALRNNRFLRYFDMSTLTCDVRIDAANNQLYDITTAFGKENIKSLNFSGQTLYAPVKLSASATEMEIDFLRTTNHEGLSVTKGTILGSPSFSIDGDRIIISNITGSSIDGKYLEFKYDSSLLAEGPLNPAGKSFYGKIYFSAISDLDVEIKTNKKKIPTGEKVAWEYELSNLTAATAEEIASNITIPVGLTIVPGSIKHDGVSVPDTYLDSSISFSDITAGNKSSITFETTAIGNAEDWLSVTSRVDWTDSTEFGPYHKTAEGAVQIKDEEQTYTPQPTEEMGLLSVPIRFDYGIKDMAKTDQTFKLSPDLYQTNTNVVTNGFYTRVKDDRAASNSTGWSLTAQLSNFVDVNNPSSGMPDSYGTALQLDGMSIEAIKDRDTASEAIDPSPSNPGPSTVESSATIIAGESAKTLVSAQPLQGLGTWQLRIPFDKVSLKIPAHAGKENSNYRAKLTWSLDDVPA